MADEREPVSAPLRRLSASMLALGRIRLELLAIEVQEEKERIALLLLWAVLAALLAGFGLVMAVLLVTVALWDSYRLLALAGGTLVLVAGAVFAWRELKRLTASPATLFQASLAELRADSVALKGEPLS